MLTGKGKIALAGLAAVAAVAAVASGKKTEASRPRAGETWHLVYSIYPDLPSQAAADQLEAFLREAVKGKAEMLDFDASSNRNTIEITYHFDINPPVDIPVGTSINMGEYTITLTEKDRVS